jgi:hypothetical protein
VKIEMKEIERKQDEMKVRHDCLVFLADLYGDQYY